MRALFLIWLLAIPFVALSQSFPERSNRLVNDFSGTLSGSEVKQLEQKLVAYDNETSVQIAIVLIQTLDGYEISNYAFELGEKWGVGRGGKDNGALILVSIVDRKMWIATGYGLEATVTDALCKRIIENEMKPRFRNRDFAGGLEAASDAIIAASRGEYAGQGDGGEESPGPVIGLVIGVIILFWLIFWGIAAAEAKRYSRINGISFWAAWALLNAARRTHEGSYRSFTGGSSGFGGGGFSGAGGFGGFGGGSFGGGGAGGSW
ncbi:MAG: hypothetical protein RL266_761 [Bacteroidota bacterium]|jgi:uncharacterized protein